MRNTDPNLEKFLKLDGGVDILLAVDPVSGSIIGDIKSNLSVSDNTAQKRIEEARKLGLLETRENHPRDHANATRCFLTKKGRICLVEIVTVNLDEKIKSYYQLTSEINSLKEAIADWTERLCVADIDEDGIKSEPPDNFMDEDLYIGENLPDGFEEFIEATLEYDEPYALDLSKFIDYNHLFDSENKDLYE